MKVNGGYRSRIVEENELVTEDTEATSKEEAEEIVEEYTENDDLALIRKGER